MSDPATRERVAALLATPEVQLALREMSGGVMKGAVDGLGLGGEDAERKVTRLAAALAAAASKSAVDAALQEATSPATQRRFSEIASAATTAATHAAIEEVRRELAVSMQEFHPALRASFNEDIGGGVHDLMTNPQVRGALSGAAYEMARQAVLGSNEAMAELEQRKQKTGMLARISGFFANSIWLLGLAFLGLLVPAIGIPVWVVRRHLASRRAAQLPPAEAAPQAQSTAGTAPTAPAPITGARRHLLHGRRRSHLAFGPH